MKLLLVLLTIININAADIYYYDWGECFTKSNIYISFSASPASINDYQQMHKTITNDINLAVKTIFKRLNAKAIIGISERECICDELNITDKVINEMNDKWKLE